MANMAYVRFENTLPDLEDCYDALNEKGFEGLSESERNYAKLLVKLCKEIADDFTEIND